MVILDVPGCGLTTVTLIGIGFFRDDDWLPMVWKDNNNRKKQMIVI